jgi:hypothetical protein
MCTVNCALELSAIASYVGGDIECAITLLSIRRAHADAPPPLAYPAATLSDGDAAPHSRAKLDALSEERALITEH